MIGPLFEQLQDQDRKNGLALDRAPEHLGGGGLGLGRHDSYNIDTFNKVVKGWAKKNVRDNGPGIPEDLRDEVFTDGFTTKAERSGLRRGLGLALVHRLVQRLGGTIALEIQDGTTFEVHLPQRIGVPT